MNIVSELFGASRRFRTLAAVDSRGHECLAPGRMLRCPACPWPALMSRTLLEPQDENRTAWHDIAPGKPHKQGFVESFIARLGEEL